MFSWNVTVQDADTLAFYPGKRLSLKLPGRWNVQQYRDEFIQALMRTQDFHKAKAETATLRAQVLKNMQDQSLREQIITQVEERYGRELLGPDFYCTPDGA